MKLYFPYIKNLKSQLRRELNDSGSTRCIFRKLKQYLPEDNICKYCVSNGCAASNGHSRRITWKDNMKLQVCAKFKLGLY